MHVIQSLKQRTGLALAAALNRISNDEISEQSLARHWLAELRKNPDLYPEGWYAPLPRGIIAAIGKSADYYRRTCLSSYRGEDAWPKTDIFYEPENIVAAYASPVQRATNLIGDFGFTLYRGTNPAIRDHFVSVLRATFHAAHSVRVDMSLRELYELTITHGKEHGLVNGVGSPSDPTGTNTGHTIPFSYEDDTAPEKDLPFGIVKDRISKARKFVNAVETQPILETMAVTVEPRFSASGLPAAWFHITVIFSKGEKTICHGFRPVMEMFGMDYLLPHLPE